ncbi:MAG TPA: Sua5/YciO/YrdC/YwlC family protein, partial [Longimicrobiales bacterium]|nr:Sua5/YciO/YrdC/YwlC family protein [Longimicrobiales bacterium]
MSGPRRLDLRGRDPGEVDLEPVARHLQGGGVVVYPTETVYGFGCLLQPEPLATLRRFKSRGPASPFLLLVEGRTGVPGLVWTAGAAEMARVFWPGALTLVLSDPGGRYPGSVRSWKGGVAVRRTSHPLAARLVEAVGGPLTSTSANAQGE